MAREIRKNKFRSHSQNLWSQTLEKRCKPFISHHTLQNLKPCLWILKILVLYTSFYHVHGCRDRQRRNRSRHRSNSILHPGRRVIIFKSKNILFSERAASEKLVLVLNRGCGYSKTSWGVACCRPLPSAV